MTLTSLNLVRNWLILSMTESFLRPSVKLSTSIPIGNAPTLTYLPLYSTPFGRVLTPKILSTEDRKCLA
ncbi:hypothetical protein WICPIJ_007113 [Wickerhamomyces pijperi]|uniref:Uncharacterized protein n=1 Tax=Wickerhamomyces pijperi TaxID=599730 RepID=A0A9P8Q0G4_WICPI|nr:hypothetical protein WICPIJ_007113 [Wickerhamomyces pijperi]